MSPIASGSRSVPIAGSANAVFSSADSSCTGLSDEAAPVPAGLPDQARRQALALGDLTGDCDQDSQHLLH